MKVELDNVTLGYSELSGSVFAGTTIKPGVWRHKVAVTQSFISCVIQKYGGKIETVTDGENEWEITVKKIKSSDDQEESTPTLKAGDYVHYTPTVGPKENGRIKSIKGYTAFVVYKCNGEWEKYEEYTGCGTELSRLSPGWIDCDEPKQ